MRIAVLAEDYPPNHGGIADYADNIVEALVQHGHEVKVVAPHVTDDDVIDNKSSASITRVGERDVRRKNLSIFKRMKVVRQMSEEVERWFDSQYSVKRPDFAILMSTSVWADICIRYEVPYCVSVHGGDAFGKRADFIRSFYRKLAVKRVLSNASLVVANSHFIHDQLVDFDIEPDRIHIGYCGVNQDFLNVVDSADIHSLPSTIDGRFLMMCRLVRFKACDVVLKAVSIVKEDYPGIRLTIAGDGPEREPLESLVDELGIRHNVDFIGYISDVGRKVDLFTDNEVFVLSGRFDPLTGRQETFGIVFIEAGACYRPVIGPRIGGVPDAIEDNVSGYLVDPDDVQSMAQAIRKMLQDPVKASSMGTSGRKRVDDTFNYRQISENIVDAMLARL